jgi:hypothetical protein
MKKLFTLTFLSIFGLTFAQVPSYVPTNGLVGWWPFNGNANDLSGNGNNGTVNGATLTTDRNGVANSAYSFSGTTTNTEIITGDCSSFPSGNSPRSISIWYYGINTSTTSQQLLGYGGETCGQSFIMNFNNPDLGPIVNPIGKYEVQGHCQSFRNYASSALPLDNYWHQIILTYDGSVFRFHNDGNLVSTSSPTTLNVVTLSKIYCFGKETNQSGTTAYFQDGILGFNGKLDDIGIWNRALTDCEIKDLYNSQLGSANTSSSTTQTAIDSYTWPVNNQTYTQSGIYTDTLVNAEGCDSIITLNLELDFTGIQTSTLPSLKLYPNPVQDVLHIDGLAGKEFEYEVLSIDGKLLQKGKSQGEISVKELRKGNYVLRVGQQQVSFVKM